MTPRLPWERDRDAPASFVAYPQGRERPNYVARVVKKPQQSSPWVWAVAAGGASASGVAQTKQEAADSATVAWPQVIEQAAVKAEEEAARQRVQDRLDEVDRQGSVDLAAFALGAQDHGALIELIRGCRERWVKHFHAGTTSPGIEKLMSALSEELFSRRVRGKAPGWNR